MPDTFSTERDRSIKEGFKMLQLGNPEAAIELLTPIANQQPVTKEVIECMRLAGIAFRQIENFEASLRYLEDSLREARRFKEPRLEELASEEYATTVRANIKSRSTPSR